MFASSMMPVLSERFDLMKDTVSAGIYANQGNPAGWLCAAATALSPQAGTPDAAVGARWWRCRE